MIFVPFLSAHLQGFELQDGQSEMLVDLQDPNYGIALEAIPSSTSAIKNGIVLACAGLVAQSAHRALAWSLISKHANGADILAISRETKKRFDASGFKRIEAIVKDGFAQGHRWAKLLGFNCETSYPMLNWFEDSTGAFLYSRCYK